MPAVAPISVLKSSADIVDKLSLDIDQCRKHISELDTQNKLIDAVVDELTAYKHVQQSLLSELDDAGEHLYDGFLPKADQLQFHAIHSLTSQTVGSHMPHFEDNRLTQLWPLYKARNYPKSLSSSEKEAWERHVERKLFAGGESSPYASFIKAISEAAAREGLSQHDMYILEELRLYAESIAPY